MSVSGDSVLPANPRRGLFGRRIRPRSITGLVLIGFAVVSAPLIVAIAASVVYVDTLNTQSERLVMQGMAVTRESKQLATLLTGMERSARQYRVLEESALIARFDEQAQAFIAELKALGELEVATLASTRLAELQERVQTLADTLGDSPEATNHVIDRLAAIRAAVEDISQRGAGFVRDELGQLQSTAADARRFLLICVFALVPGVIALGLLLTHVISRPLRQILAAINRLGTGEMTQRVEIVAPVADLDQLGDRLDWMRRRLATQEDEKQQFLRHMSHELKTPLASIQEGAGLLVDGSLGSLAQKQQEVAALIERNSLELASLIENLLNFAAWREHYGHLDVSRFDLTALIRRLVERQRLTIESRDLTVRLPARPVDIEADIDRMQLIIDNLVANAVKYARRGGLIRIDAERSGDMAHLYVRDDGPGVAVSEREHIFEAFMRSAAPEPEISGVKGTGIGLSVVRECALAHGGHAEVISTDDHHSVFHVRIPQAQAAA